MKPIDTTRLHALRGRLAERTGEMAALALRYQRIAGRHENGTAPRAVSTTQLFQTPATLAARLVALLSPIDGARVLEPSAGLGRILDALAQAGPPSGIVAVEIASQCATELVGRSGVEVRCRDFLTCTPDELGTFDAIAMNPPFTMRSDIAHIRHALGFLRPGGTLAALCMNTEHRHAALSHLSSTWEPIEAGAFRSEGTGVGTILLTIKKAA